MLAGRVVGDIVSIAIGAGLIDLGVGGITGGAGCAVLTAGGCTPIGAAAVVAGGALAIEGAGISARGAVGLGTNLYLMAKKHKIYVSETEEGTYVGRTVQDLAKRQAQHQAKGYNRILTQIDETEILEEAMLKEQLNIDKRGGINNLTNKRNELNPKRFLELLKKYVYKE